MNFEEIIEYPLAGKTGFDVDDTLLMIRCMEMNKEKIANDPEIAMLIKKILKHIYKDYSSTVLKLDEIDMDSFIDALYLTVRW